MKKQDFINKWIGWVSYSDREKLAIEMESDLQEIEKELSQDKWIKIESESRAGLKHKFQNMEKLNRGDKIYLDDKAKTKESTINNYLSCRDGIVEVFEYNDSSGYGSKTRLFLCENTKHEVTSIVRQTWNDFDKEWIEEEMTFDTDSFVFLKALINNKKEELGGKYSLVRDY